MPLCLGTRRVTSLIVVGRQPTAPAHNLVPGRIAGGTRLGDGVGLTDLSPIKNGAEFSAQSFGSSGRQMDGYAATHGH